MSLLVERLHGKKAILHKSTYELCKDLCCASDNLRIITCLERCCSKCKNKMTALLSTCEENDTITYHQWETKKVPITVKGIEKICQKSVKEQYTSTIRKTLKILKAAVPKFLCIKN